MNVEVRKNLIDILQAAEEIRGFMKGMDFHAYLAKKGSSLVLAHSRDRRLSSCVSAATPFNLNEIFVADVSGRGAAFKSASQGKITFHP